MADIDIVPGYTDGFEISLGDNSRGVSGNVALLNRFQITFFTEGLFFNDTDGGYIIDNYGGRAVSMIGTPRALSDIQGITVALTSAISNTVESIQRETPDGVPDTERLDRAELTDVSISNGTVNAVVDVYPVELQQSELPRFYIPIVSG